MNINEWWQTLSANEKQNYRERFLKIIEANKSDLNYLKTFVENDIPEVVFSDRSFLSCMLSKNGFILEFLPKQAKEDAQIVSKALLTPNCDNRVSLVGSYVKTIFKSEKITESFSKDMFDLYKSKIENVSPLSPNHGVMVSKYQSDYKTIKNFAEIEYQFYTSKQQNAKAKACELEPINFAKPIEQ